MNLVCSVCGRRYPTSTYKWRCDCGGVFELDELRPFSRQAIDTAERSLWRYRHMLPVEHEANFVSLGEGSTPMVEASINGLNVLCKLEFLAPTGSFKDRGAAVMVSVLKEMGVTAALDDSSGNAAASLAAYCGRAGMRAHIYVPAYASPAKLAQITVYGANLVAVEGSREKTTEAAEEAAHEIYYASHNCSPFFVEGTKTFAYEVWEHLGRRAPDNLVFPVGNGSLLMGAYRGFAELQAGGLVERLPRIFGAQAQACAPIYAGFAQRSDDARPVTSRETAAEGIRIARPVRGRQILRAVHETGGAMLAVAEPDIHTAQATMARMGLYIEPTSAVAVAALSQLGALTGRGDTTVVALTGSGLKGG